MKTLTDSTIRRLNAQARKLTDSMAIPDAVEACAFVAARIGLKIWFQDNTGAVYKSKNNSFVNLNYVNFLDGPVGFNSHCEWAIEGEFLKRKYP